MISPGMYLTTVEMKAPTAQRIHSQRRLHLFIGSCGERVGELATELVGRWLSDLFHQQFVESRTNTANEFGTEVFHEALDQKFSPRRALIAAIGMLRGAQSPAAEADSGPRLYDLMSRLEPVTLISQGSAHAYLNRTSGRAQVWLDQLPGSIEFVAADAWARTSRATQACRRAGVSARSRDAVAWYGFGVPNGDPAEIVADIERQLKRNTAYRNADMLVRKNV